MPRARVGESELETDNGKRRVGPDASDNTNAMQCTRQHDMDEMHTRTRQNEEPENKEPGIELMKPKFIYCHIGKVLHPGHYSHTLKRISE